jgi:hypothetical protein
MTLLILYLHIHFQFIIPPILIHFILNSQLKLSIFKHRGKTFIFLFAPCVPSINPQFTLRVTTSSFLNRF